MNSQLLQALPGILTFGVLVGACTGAVVHLLSSRLARRQPDPRRMLLDCLLGALAFLAGVAAVMFIPIPTHTETTHAGGLVMRVTNKRFQHPYWVALTLAVFLPVLLETALARRGRRGGQGVRR